MGPLFSAVVLGLGLLAAFALVYAGARFFRAAMAVRMAAIVVLGSALGGIALALTTYILWRPLATDFWQVMAYFLLLGAGAISGSAVLLLFCVHRGVLTLRSSEPPQSEST